MVDGVRRTESSDRRVTEAGDRRITENFIPGETYNETLSLSSSGALAAAALRTAFASSTLAGILTQSSVATVTRPAGATLSASGTISPSALRTTFAGSSLAGSATLSLTPTVIRNVNSSLSSASTFNSIATRITFADTTLVGSLATLSASTISRGAVAALSSSGSLSGEALVAKNMLASLAASGVTSGKLGFQLSVQSSQSASGQLSAIPSIIRNVSATKSATGTFNLIPTIVRNVQANFSSAGSVAPQAQFQADARMSVGSSGNFSASGLVTRNASSSLIGLSEAIISPQLIFGIVTLRGGAATLTADAQIVRIVDSDLVSFGTLNGNLDMIHNAVFGPLIERRVTESGDTRITEEGNFRSTSGGDSTAGSRIIVESSLISFSEGLYAKNGGNWKAVMPQVFHNGAWVIPKVYVKDNDTWKRVY